MMKHLFSFTCLLILSLNLFAQNGIIKGFVYEKETGDPILFTNIHLKDTKYGSTTNENGYFAIINIPPGDYTLVVAYVGYKKLEMNVTVSPNDVQSVKYYLENNATDLDEIQISASRIESATETKTAMVKLTPQDIQRLPSIGGQADIAQYMQVLPGVVFTGDQGGQLYIRGSSPIQNLVLLDGLYIYNPFHSIGLFSVFDTELIRTADIYTGGFGAEFGGRISSVMNITTKDGNKTKHSGKVALTTFGANLTLEGPLKRFSLEGSSSASYILSAKRSYLDQTAKSIYSYIGKEGLPFSFTDIYGKVSYHASNGSKINFFGFNYNDKVHKYRSLSDFHWNATGVGSNFLIIPGKSTVLIEGRVGYSNYKAVMDEENMPERTSYIDGFNLGVDFLYILGLNNIKYGIEINGGTTDFHFVNMAMKTIRQRENTTELGSYFKGKFIIDKWILEPSFRIHYFTSLAQFSPEPRFAVKYNASNSLRLKMAGGIYAQNLISANNPHDVVSLFYGILSGPDNLPEYFDGKKIKSKLQHAQHIIVGAEYDFSQAFSSNVEVYYKNLSQITSINRNKIYEDNGNPDIIDELKKDFLIEKGNAYGLDVSVKYHQNRLNLWTVYSLGFVNYKNGHTTYSPHFDRRHNLNMMMNYQIGKSKDWELNVRWNLGSGFPFTQTQGAFGLIDFSDGIETDYTTVNEQFSLIFADYNTARLSYYHRLDLGIKKIFYISKHSNIEFTGGITNVYNRKNIFFIDRLTNKRVNQLPIMPSIGVIFAF